MIVVFDTNIWKSNLYLHSPVSAAVSYFLHMRSAKVGLPEVIRLEVERHLRHDIEDLCAKINQDHKRLLGIVGKLREVVLPDDRAIAETVDKFFSLVNFDLVDVPFSERSAKSSFFRTVDKTPPSHKTQQFKDGVLWEDCKQLAESDDVILVSGDHAFFEGDNPKKGLAAILKIEASQCSHSLRILPTLSDLLGEIRKPVSIRDDVLVKGVVNQMRQYIDQMLERTGFSLNNDWNLQRSFYATENPTVLFFELNGTIDCQDVSGEDRTEGMLNVKVSGRYNTVNRQFSDLLPNELSVSYKTVGGEPESRRNLFAVGISTTGHRMITHVVKERLD